MTIRIQPKGRRAAAKRSTLPRKQPAQSRSKATVRALVEAGAQVLVTEGWGQLTTSKVAQRAGVSIGTLYQYYPSKEALMKAVADAHVDRITLAVAQAATEASSLPLMRHIEVVLRALYRAKLGEGKLSTAITLVLLEIEGPLYVERALHKSQALVRMLLQMHQREHQVADVDLAAFVLVRAVNGVVSALLLRDSEPLDEARVVAELVRLAEGYLGLNLPAAASVTDFPPRPC